MRVLFLILFVFVCNELAFTQKVDTLHINGFYAIEYDKKTVKKNYKNKKKRLKGKSFESPIDVYYKADFIPIEKRYETTFKEALHSYSSEKAIFAPRFTCKTPLFFNRFFSEKIDSSNNKASLEICTQTNLFRVKGNNEKLYNVYWLEGKFLRIVIEDTESNVSNLFKKYPTDCISVKNGIQGQEIFFLLEIKAMSSYTKYGADKTIKITKFFY